MAAFNKFNAFVEHFAEKVHDLSADTLKILLTNTAPAATNSLKADLTEIAAGDPQRAVYTARFAGPQGAPLWASPALILGIGWNMILKKIAGADRALNRRISKVA
jgi:hypothetical protein